MSTKRRAGLMFLLIGVICLIASLALHQTNLHEAQEAESASRKIMEEMAAAMTGESRERDHSGKRDKEADPAGKAAATGEKQGETSAPGSDETAGEESADQKISDKDAAPQDPSGKDPETENGSGKEASRESLPEDSTVQTLRLEGNDYIGFLTIRELELELPVMESWDYERLKIAPCRYSGSAEGGDLVIAAHNYRRHFGGLSGLSVGSEILFTDISGSSTRYTVAELEILKPGDVEKMTAGEYDLTLFTCTYGGQSRYTVRCIREG